jgi:cytosine deaminase
LRAIAELTERFEMQGRVTCGHACSLSAQPREEALETLKLCARAGIHLIGLPTTNAYLQGSWAETPLERGIFRINEAHVTEISASIATDNVADGFFPYGSYDLLDTFAFGVQLAHLHPADAWLSSITVAPARAMQLPWDGMLRVGAPDLLQLKAHTAYQLITPKGRERRVIRGGVFL